MESLKGQILREPMETTEKSDVEATGVHFLSPSIEYRNFQREGRAAADVLVTRFGQSREFNRRVGRRTVGRIAALPSDRELWARRSGDREAPRVRSARVEAAKRRYRNLDDLAETTSLEAIKRQPANPPRSESSGEGRIREHAQRLRGLLALDEWRQRKKVGKEA
ncbi:hypothetical protein KM043_002120 [Ampulex compressa]|nr:hypothetical protein KM043_002120 [Ampulex compressa]